MYLSINCVLWGGSLSCAIISSTGYNNNKLFNSSTLHHFVQQSLSCIYNYYQSKVTDGCMYWLFTWIEWTNAVTSSTTYSTTCNSYFCKGLDFLITQHTVTLGHCSFYTPCSNRSSWPTNPDGMYQISREREKDQHSPGDWCQVSWLWSFPARRWKSTKDQSYSSRVCKQGRGNQQGNPWTVDHWQRQTSHHLEDPHRGFTWPWTKHTR